jgi:ATP-binding protein involved in chromosome partitioning
MVLGFGKKQTFAADVLRAVEDAVSSVEIPFMGGKSAADLDLIGSVSEKAGRLVVEVVLPTMAFKGKDALVATLRAAAKTALGNQVPDKDVDVQVLSNVKPAATGAAGKLSLVGIQNVVLVASGKGGVGKSFVAVNLAAALARHGCKTGLLDADVYGPSVPTMTGVLPGARPGTLPGPSPDRPLLVPLERHGLRLMSIGFLVDTSAAMVWRGPMIASASMQMFRDVAWGDLDYLVVDLPPGTGDIHLTISQQIVVAGSVIVSTPQDVALADVVRAKAMFDKVGIPCIGLVENMSYFLCDGCGKRHDIFDHGGAKRAAERLGVPFLGEVPIETSVREGGDQGAPVVVSHPESVSARAFLALAEDVATAIARDAESGSLVGPTISITGGSIAAGRSLGGGSADRARSPGPGAKKPGKGGLKILQ